MTAPPKPAAPPDEEAAILRVRATTTAALADGRWSPLCSVVYTAGDVAAVLAALDRARGER